ncbi:restriction endonuclease [Verrucomicrobia bacterium]|nr:restriction endonuclease [Verrucomicrobiota bacterium]
MFNRARRGFHPPHPTTPAGLSQPSASQSSRLTARGGRGWLVRMKLLWNTALLKAIEWKRFEEVVAKYFELRGFKAKETGNGPDGGIDIELYRDKSKDAVTLIQCKSQKQKVAESQVRDFYGAITKKGIENGLFATTSSFTNPAKKFAQDTPIELLSNYELVSRFNSLCKENLKELLDYALIGDSTTPSCPTCGNKLIQKTKSTVYWGCPQKGCSGWMRADKKHAEKATLVEEFKTKFKSEKKSLKAQNLEGCEKKQIGSTIKVSIDSNRIRIAQELVVKALSEKKTFITLENLSLRDSDLQELLRINEGNISCFKGINLSKNKIRNIIPISELKNLISLDLSFNDVESLSSLNKLSKLEELDVSSNQLSNIYPLKKLENLITLKIWGNKIIDIRALSELQNLKYLSVSSNRIFDVRPLSNLNKLTYLNLVNNKIKNFEPLLKLSNLYLRFLRNPISVEQTEMLKKEIKCCLEFKSPK